MSRCIANNVERLLVFPGRQCACCAGRFGFKNGLRELVETDPTRTRKEILKLNPIYIRQLPSFKHQQIHVETMMTVMTDDLPKLVKKWRQHLQTYPEMPYLLHYMLENRDCHSLAISTESIAACEKASPFSSESPELLGLRAFSLKEPWPRLEVLQEILRGFMGLLEVPREVGIKDRWYLSQSAVLFSDQLQALYRQGSSRTFSTGAAGHASRDEGEQSRIDHCYWQTIIDSAYHDLAETILPKIIRASVERADRRESPEPHLLLSEFFEMGGSYKNSRFDIASFLLGVEPELMLHLNRHRSKLNGASIEVMDSNLEDVRNDSVARRAAEADRELRRWTGQLQQQTNQEELGRERQRTEAERTEHRAAVRTARNESLFDMTRRLSSLDPLSRMRAVAGQIAYSPSSFPTDWAREFTDDYIGLLDSTTLEALVEKTRGVRRGEWKNLHRRLITEDR